MGVKQISRPDPNPDKFANHCRIVQSSSVFKQRGALHALRDFLLPGRRGRLRHVEPLEERLDGYFHFHGVRGALHQQLGQVEAARVAYDRAIALAHTPAEAAHIRMHLDALLK